MAKLSLNSIRSDVFKVNANETADCNETRASIVGAGRLLAYEYARKGTDALHAALRLASTTTEPKLTAMQYKELNEKFQAQHLLYAANKVCEFTGQKAPESFDELKRNASMFFNNKHF